MVLFTAALVPGWVSLAAARGGSFAALAKSIAGRCSAAALHIQSATLQKPSPKESVRGVWVYPPASRDEATGVPQIQKTLEAYAEAGINTVILLVKDTAGNVYYQSAIGVAAPAWNYDCLDVWLREAKKRSIAVHAWFCVFNEGAVLGQPRQHLDWLVTNRRRRTCRTPSWGWRPWLRRR